MPVLRSHAIEGLLDLNRSVTGIYDMMSTIFRSDGDEDVHVAVRCGQRRLQTGSARQRGNLGVRAKDGYAPKNVEDYVDRGPVECRSGV
jgi:hypothetical protein